MQLQIIRLLKNMVYNVKFLFLDFRYVVGLLVLLSCVVVFRLPILLIYFNELHLNQFSELPSLWGSFKSNNKINPSQTLASQPYFLVEDGSLVVAPEVNEAMETVCFVSHMLNHSISFTKIKILF